MSLEHVNTCKVSLEGMTLICDALMSFASLVKYDISVCSLRITLLQRVLKFFLFTMNISHSQKRKLTGSSSNIFRPRKAFFSISNSEKGTQILLHDMKLLKLVL